MFHTDNMKVIMNDKVKNRKTVDMTRGDYISTNVISTYSTVSNKHTGPNKRTYGKINAPQNRK